MDCEYFRYVFSVFDGKLLMESITCEDNKPVTVSSMLKEYELTCPDWNVICFTLASAVKYIHLQNLLRNGSKSNVLLKLTNNVWIPKMVDMAKVTLKSIQKHIN